MATLTPAREYLRVFTTFAARSADAAKSTAQSAVEWWMGSPDHRDLILHELLTVEGIGVVISENKILVTENFC